jgi:NDP-sugar pyrophosphorylase family protein
MKNNDVNAYIDNESFWMDVGNPESLKTAEENFDNSLLL